MTALVAEEVQAQPLPWRAAVKKAASATPDLAYSVLNGGQMAFAPRILTGMAALWLAVVSAGSLAFYQYQAVPGAARSTPPLWPRDTLIRLDRNKLTLLMFVHPKCPCTRASIEQLNQVLARSQEKIAVYAVILKPAGAGVNWIKTGSWASLAGIPGVELVEDRDGKLAERFGAETSGQVVVYDPKGKLCFSGGITGSRGHAGDNAGQSAIISLADGSAGIGQTPVFGCSLQDDLVLATGGVK